ncbi:non-ribosomal peptide synthetase [Pseudomonas agarici]|uniref:non-ribosomal peptide synthetase n=1 Tax=Pseudomonas agarici TaxID=46677 RepID=UPI000314AFEF|nr:non-ribosomal peptide synthetase [Pseudomonas agarici]NWC11126.1 non-ribosomal peptide synthetase [Pseudomonas agarici]SEL58134.1 amino acid adenylation domain-containing protein [Pseudomonas agarici]
MNRPSSPADVYPLTTAQRQIWFDQGLHEGAPLYKIGGHVRIAGTVDPQRFERAVNRLVRKHDALRIVLTSSIDEHGVPLQRIVETLAVEVPFHDFSEREDAESAALALLEQRLEAPFTLIGRPLFRFELVKVSDARFYFTLNFHHLIVDGWAIGLLVESLSTLYSEAQTQDQAEPAPSYRDFIAQDQAFEHSPQQLRNLEYWLDKYRTLPDPLFTPRHRTGPQQGLAPGGHECLRLSRAFFERIIELARACDSTPFHVLLGIFHVYFSRTERRDELSIAVPTLNRGSARLKSTAGMFVGVSPLRLSFDPHLSFSALVTSLGRMLKQDYRYQRFPLSELNRTLGLWRSQRAQLFDLTVSYERDDHDLRFDGAPAQVIMGSNRHEQDPLTVHIRENKFDENVWIHFFYNQAYFDPGEIRQISLRLRHMLEQVLDNAELPVSRLSLVTAPELRQLDAWNATDVAFAPAPMIHRQVEAQAARSPDAIAIEQDGHRLTYAQLNSRANVVAHRLMALGVKADQCVTLCTQRSLDSIVGMLGILKSGAGYVPMDPAYPAERLRYILDETAPKVMLIHHRTAHLLPETAMPQLDLGDLQAMTEAQRANPDPIGCHGTSLAYVIYTSGSTGRPKGVMVEHRQLNNLIAWHNQRFALGEGSRSTWFAGVGFDASVWEIWTALSVGGTLLLPPAHTVDDPRALLQWWKAQTVDLAILITPLAELAYASDLANPVASQVLIGGDRLRQWPVGLPAGQALINTYGPTEATVLVTAGQVHQHNAALHIGRPVANTRIHILDEFGQRVPPGAVGELYLAGAHVARGYLNQPGLTAERFIDDPFSAAPGARMYKSGDLGRWMADGNIEFLGRNDDQVKIRGFRIELGEIETTLVSLPGVLEVAVLAREDSPGEVRLVAYYTGIDGLAEGLSRRAGEVLPVYMVPSAFVHLAAFPVTVNGKLDRRALPAPQACLNHAYEAPQGEREQALALLWQQVLGVERVGRHDNFFELGGHSLSAVRLIQSMRRQGMNAEPRALFGAPTLQAFARHTGTGQEVEIPANRIEAGCLRITPDLLPLIEMSQEQIDGLVENIPGGVTNVQDIYPLAPLQEGILYQYLSTSGGDPYVSHGLFALDHRARLDDFIRALQTVIDRHDILRTALVWEGQDVPLQVVLRDVSLPLHWLNFQAQDGDIAGQLIKRFDVGRSRLDLRQAPLLRLACTFDESNDRWLALLIVHHLAMDHAGLSVLQQEMQAYLLDQQALLPGATPYRNYVVQSRHSMSAASHEAFFREMLQDIESPTLPFGVAQARDDASVIAVIQPVPLRVAERLRTHARGLGVSTASLFHLAWGRVLSMLSGQTEVVFGTVLLGRMQGASGEHALGLFINTLPLRLTLASQGVAASVRDTAARVANLLAHEHAPLALAQRCSGVAPGTPLFSALLNYRRSEHQGQGAGPLNWQGIELLEEYERTHYPLTLSVDDAGQGFELNVQAVTGIDAQLVCDSVQTVLASLVDALERNPEQAVHDLVAVPARERLRVLADFNATDGVFAQALTLHQLFEKQVRATPEAIALTFEDQSLTYEALNRQANRVAHQLIERGVRADDRVAICVERSLDMLIGLLGILKSGGAYVPLDPGYPLERLVHMLEDSAPVALLLHGPTRGLLRADAAICLDLADVRTQAQFPSHDPALAQDWRTLAYVIYTSGSSGRPKGVMNEHRGVVNRLQWMQQALSLTAQDVILQKTPFSFDVSVWEFFWPLMVGAKLVIARPEGHGDAVYLAQLIARERISTVHFVPSMLQVFLESAQAAECHSLTRVVCSGEALALSLIRRFSTVLPDTGLHNLYGPTEAAVDVTAWACSAEDSVSLIGRPIANTRIYILDTQGQPVPVGIAGELHIAGVQVARGYLNLPRLTAERFVDDRFSEAPGARMYKTGDLGRWLPNGAIEYLGRNDDQVKIRGFRIEPGEIETVLAQMPGLREVVVLARHDERSGQRLVAYYTGSAVAPEALREHVGGRLAPYMVPAAFVHLDAWPLTPNGKLDRKALPAPHGAYARAIYQAPQGDVENALAGIWSRLLNVEPVSRHDNFFELGGHSLLAVSLIEHMRRVGLFAQVAQLLGAPTLAELARQVSTEQPLFSVPANAIPPHAEHITPAMLPLVRLTPPAIERIVARVAGGAANVQDIYPLAPLQEGILYHHLSATGGDPYVLHALFAFTGQAAFEQVVQAMQQVIDRHDVLRTAVLWEGLDAPVQVVWRRAPVTTEYFSADPREGDVAEQLLRRFDVRQRGIDLDRAPLIHWAYAEDESHRRGVGLLRFHHIVMDHVALAFVQREVQAILAGQGATLAVSVPYRDYVAQARSSGKAQAHEAFFRERLHDVDEPTLPYGIAGIQADADPVTQASASVSGELALRLRSQARQLAVSAASLYHLAWARVLAVLAGRDDVVFGSVLLGRLQGGAGADRALGLFINTLPVRIDAGAAGVQKGVRQTSQALAALLGHEHASLALAQRCSGVAAPTPLFSALLNYRHGDEADGLAVGQYVWPGVQLLSAHERTHYPLVLCVDDIGNDFGLIVQATHGIDPQQVCDCLHTTLASLVEALECAPDTPINALRVLPQQQRSQVLEAFNPPRFDYSRPQTLHELFEAQAQRSPNAFAVTFEGQSLTYAELNARANRVAHRLIAHGVKPDDRVAICVEPGVAMIVGLLGILKSAGGYVPLDPGYPAARLAYMLADSQPTMILVTAATRDVLGRVAVAQLDIAQLDSGPQSNPCVAGHGAGRLAYVIYTSGSTGQPKGVMVEHGNVTRLFEATASLFSFNSDDVWALFHSFAFDFSVWEIWGALLHGGRLLVVAPLTRRSPPACYTLLCEERVSVLNQTPSAFRQLIAAQGASPLTHCLRQVIFGGEALDVASLKPWYARPDNGLTQLVNMYGITETTVHVTYRALTETDTRRIGASPIGGPIADLRLYLLDARREPVPVGVVGELYVSGPGVTRGYLNQPQLTAERFLDDPFSAAPCRMYKTGDLGRWLANGEIEYLGRNDDQVKIRGFRIELGEIEGVLGSVEGVTELVVIARQDTPGDQRLVAYYTADEGLNERLRTQAASRLPAHMVPSAFVHLPGLPLTANGKLDRAGLPAPGGDAVVRAPYEPPQGAVESTLARIWSQLLNVESVSRYDNFFELGGHSLLAVSLVERMRQAHLFTDIRQLFGAPTLAELARHIVTRSPELAIPPNRIPRNAERIVPDMLPLVTVDQAALDTLVAQVPGGAANVQDIYPLAPLQEGILFHHLIEQERDPYVLSGALGFRTRSAVQRFIEALQQVIDRHEILRTGFVWHGLEQAVQVVHRKAQLMVNTFEVTAPEQKPPQRIDITRPPLLNCSLGHDQANDRWLLNIVFHHLVLDHTSLDLVLEEARAIEQGRADCLPTPAPFRNFIAQTCLAESRAAHEFFFREMLGDIDEPTAPFDVLDINGDGHDALEVQHLVPDTLSRRLRSQARRHGVSAASVMHLAWALVLAKTTGRDSVVFATVLFGRLQGGEAADRVLGLFINTLPLRVDIGRLDTAASLRQTHDRLVQLLVHEHAPLSLAQRCSAVTAPAPLFTTLFNYRYSADAPQAQKNRRLGDDIEHLGGRERTNYPLTMAVDDLGEAFSLTVQAVAGIDGERVCGYMLTALEHINEALESASAMPVCALQVLPAQERMKLLDDRNALRTDYPPLNTLHQLFEMQAERSPNAFAVTFAGQSLTYAELNARANHVAHDLIAQGVKPDDRVAICVEPSLEMMVGVLGILKSGAGYVPLDPGYPAERLAYMLGDSQPLAVLVTPATREVLGPLAITQLDIAQGEGGPRHNPCVPGAHAARLAYVIYTSGSTGQPKGVMVEHRNVTRLFDATASRFGFNGEDTWALFHSFAFDFSVWEIWGAWLHGGRLLVIPPLTRRSAQACYALLCDERVTVLNQTPSAFRQLITAQGESPQSHYLRQVILGGEALEVASLKPWYARPRNGATQLVNMYGITETTVHVTYRALTEADTRYIGASPIGIALDDLRLYLLDAWLEPVPLGVVGELYVGGAGVARGYLNRPQLTAERFLDDPFSHVPARLYKTGDLGRRLANGEIEYLGRNDDQVKIRGFRIELGEIEGTLSAVDGVAEVVVVAREDTPGSQRLVAYYTGTRGLNESLRARAASNLPAHMVPSAFVHLPDLPLTANGKLKRSALPAPDDSALVRARYEPAQGEIEVALAQIWSRLLTVEAVSRHDNFFELGGDSLLAMRVAGSVRQQFGDQPALRALFESRSLKEFAAQVASACGVARSPVVAQPRDIPLPLSFVQERLWLIQARDGGRAYNWHGALLLEGVLSLNALQSAFDALVARHEPLRTRFLLADGDDVPAQCIEASCALRLAVSPVTPQYLTQALQAHAGVEFDLRQGRLIRAEVLRLAPQRHVLSIVIHHIVCDGWSTSVLVRDLRALYAAHLAGAQAQLAPLTIQHADYAHWQRRQDLTQHLDYWRTALDGQADPIDLAVPGTPASVTPGPAGVVRRRVSEDLAKGLAQFSQQRGTSLFSVLLAGWTLLVHRQTGYTDVCTGTTVAGRDDPVLDPLIGFFVNILPLRVRLDGQSLIADVLDQVHAVVLQALEHQALPFEQMLAVAPRLRQADGRSPLPVMLRHQNFPGIDTQAWSDQMTVSEWPIEADRPAQADLDLEVFGDARQLDIVASFDSLRFSPAQVELMVSIWLEMLDRLIHSPRLKVASLLALTPSEHALIARSNDTTQVFEQTSVTALFTQQVSRRPDAIACIDNGQEITFAGLDQRCNAVVAALQSQGIAPGARIALYQPRSADFLACVLAVFKLGGTYVPIDPGYQASYVQRILEAAMPAWVLTTSDLAAGLAHIQLPLLRLDRDVDQHASATVVVRDNQPDDPAYIAYTSGSTGQPKGVLVEHRQLLNGLQALWARTPFAPDEVVAQKTSMSFVPSIKEMLCGLLVGVPQVIVADHTVQDAAAFATALREYRVTRLNLVPSHLNALLDHAAQLGRLRHVVTAGEPLSRQVKARFARLLPRARLYNNYGCTELNDITYSEGEDLAGLGAVMPAGRPIANVQVQVLDEQFNPVPVGAVGAIFVEGANVGPGYWNPPASSPERFIVLPSGARALMTGDIGMWLADGQLMHLGREDFQIKVRGQRVELNAVELALGSYPGLRKVAAVARRAGGEHDQLIGFYISDGAPIDHNELHHWLAQRLPGAMVPSRLVPLSALPMLANGKLDRLALRTMPLNALTGMEHTDDAPQGELESALAAIWAQVLEVDRIGRHDNFFALGGHSLMASQLVVRIREALAVDLSVRSLFDTRSVARLAALLNSQAGVPSDQASVQAFNREGRQRPLFLTHTLQGYAWYFEHLAGHIDADVPVYGLPALPLSAEPLEDLVEIAARFVAVVRQIQHQGPYRIAGWSFGGLIAYEMATQLREAGESIEFLGLFDTTLAPLDRQDSTHHASLVTLHAFVTNNFAEHEPDLIEISIRRTVEEVVEDIVEALEKYKRAGKDLWHLAHDTPQENRQFLYRMLGHGKAMHAWRPRALDARLHLFIAQDTALTPLEGHAEPSRYLGWEQLLAPSAMVLMSVPGDHETIIKRHADQVGALISEVLKG